MRKTLSDRGVAALKPREARFAYPDPELRGHWIRVTPSGLKSFVVVTRGPNGKQVWKTIGSTDAMTIVEARDEARSILQRVRSGLPAAEAKAETFADVAANWLQRHVEAKGLRSVRDILRQLNAHILPEWKDRPFVSIRRSDVAALLDKVEDDHGARVADYTLSVVSGIMNWFAARTDDYVPPLVKGMARRTKASRSRVLDDDELRLVWRKAESYGGPAFSAIVRLCILTGQRSRKVSTMKWSDLQDGVWNIAREPREKGTAGALTLPIAALAIIGDMPRFASNPHVFPALSGDGPFTGFGNAKALLDTRLPADMPPWTIHDLRRTARSCLSRAGVSTEVSERIMGHAIPGVAGVYNRHDYIHEKGDALRRLAGLVDAIVNQRRANVVPIDKKKRQRR